MKRRVQKKYENALKKHNVCTPKYARTLLNFARNYPTPIEHNQDSRPLRVILQAAKKIEIEPVLQYDKQWHVHYYLTVGEYTQRPHERVKYLKNRFYRQTSYTDGAVCEFIYDMVNRVEYLIVNFDFNIVAAITPMIKSQILPGSVPDECNDHCFNISDKKFSEIQYLEKSILVPRIITMALPCDNYTVVKFMSRLFRKMPVRMEEE